MIAACRLETPLPGAFEDDVIDPLLGVTDEPIRHS